MGDPEQLGPVVRDPDNPLECSALHRIVRDAPPDRLPPMLEVQHRMSAAVQRLVEPVYGPRYRPAPTVRDASLDAMDGVASTTLTRRAQLFIDTAGTGGGMAVRR